MTIKMPAGLCAALIILGLSACATAPEEPVNLQVSQVASDSALIAASGQGDINSVRELTKAGTAINGIGEKGTAIYDAVDQNHADVVLYLLRAGADPDLHAAQQLTPLMLAAQKGDRNMVRLLLAGGAKINTTDEQGRNASALAAMAGNLSVLKLLLDAGGNVNVVIEGQSLLMKVVAGGDLLTTQTLIAAGADVRYRSANGDTALSIARAKRNSDIEMLLVQQGAES